MPYQILPNILFIFAILGILLIVLRHLPEAVSEDEYNKEIPVEHKLHEKGLPAVAISKVSLFLKVVAKRMWNFFLEAKDIKPTSVAGYQIKKMFRNKPAPVAAQETPPDVPASPKLTEEHFLELIKKEPKNLTRYSDLGKFYLDSHNIDDAKDIYQYLSNHEPSNAEYHARLAFCYYKMRNFTKASEQYTKSVGLDSTQPNRYYNLGMSLEAGGNPEEAVDAFRQAIALESGNSKYYIALSDTLLKLGQRNEAKVTLRSAKKINPDDIEVIEKLKIF